MNNNLNSIARNYSYMSESESESQSQSMIHECGNSLGLVKIDEQELSNLHKSIEKHYRLECDYGISYHSPYFKLFTNYGWRRNWAYNNRWRLQKIVKKTKRIDYIGYMAKTRVWDRIGRRHTWRNAFIKECPLIPIEFTHNYHECLTKKVELAHPVMEDCIGYLHSLESQAHIETFITYACSRLTETGVCPGFPAFYGALRTTLKEWTKDVTDSPEYENIQEFIDAKDGENTYMLFEYECSGTLICRANRFPVILMATEKVRDDLFTLARKTQLTTQDLASMWWQVVFAIHSYQTLLGITHNDLHVSNIMYKTTDKTYLYYKLGEEIYKVPTYGRIWKIIDFGRGTLKAADGKLLSNTVFNSNGECSNVIFSPRLNGLGRRFVEPHFAVDVMTLAMNLLNDVMDKSLSLRNSNDYDYYEKFIKNEAGDRICYLEKELTFNDHIRVMNYQPPEWMRPASILRHNQFGFERIRLEDIADGEEIWGL